MTVQLATVALGNVPCGAGAPNALFLWARGVSLASIRRTVAYHPSPVRRLSGVVVAIQKGGGRRPLDADPDGGVGLGLGSRFERAKSESECFLGCLCDEPGRGSPT